MLPCTAGSIAKALVLSPLHKQVPAFLLTSLGLLPGAETRASSLFLRSVLLLVPQFPRYFPTLFRNPTLSKPPAPSRTSFTRYWREIVPFPFVIPLIVFLMLLATAGCALPLSSFFSPLCPVSQSTSSLTSLRARPSYPSASCLAPPSSSKLPWLFHRREEIRWLPLGRSQLGRQELFRS